MTELEKTLSDIARYLVDDPDSVTVSGTENGDTVTLSLNVAPDDMGKVIGKHGRIARAIRVVMKSVGNRYGKKVTVDIED